MRTGRRTSRAVALVSVAALLVACGSDTRSDTVSSTPATQPAPAGDAGAASITAEHSVASGESSAGADGATPASTSDAITSTTIRIGPLTPRNPDRITDDDRAAIAAIGASGALDPDDAHGHTHGAPTFMPLLTGDAATFANQWLAAQRATSRFDTLDEIKALGYVRSSAPIAGIGSHWVLWPQIAKPFDAANPSMVLFDESIDPPVLVGFSYWLQSPTMPEGFAGPNDHWHQHQGLCVVNGWVDRERATGADVCGGTFFAGGDLWMLHAWPVADYPNKDGNFATVNPMLCPAATGVPDIARCAPD